MIVVDTNLIVYLFIQGEYTETAECLAQRDPEWASVRLWRSEFRNVLVHHLKSRILTIETAVQMMREAERFMQDREHDVSSSQVLELANGSGCSAYDCEFVALAEALDAPLVTSDKQILRAFPKIALSPQNHLSTLS